MRSRLQRYLPRPTTIGLVLIAMLLVTNGLISEWNIFRLVKNEHRVLHSEEVLTTLEKVLSSITEAETGERGFLITDKEDYLDFYRSAVERTHETLDKLEKITAEDAEQKKKIVLLRQKVAARFEELEAAIAAQGEGGFTAARISVSTNRGRELMKEMRAVVGQMQ